MTSFGDGVHGARPPIGSDQAAATYRFGKGAVRTAKRGDADASSEEAGRQCLCGVYRGVVTNNIDPASQFRVQLRLNADPSAPPLWALPCQPVDLAAVPAVGVQVWIAFEGGIRAALFGSASLDSRHHWQAAFPVDRLP